MSSTSSTQVGSLSPNCPCSIVTNLPPLQAAVHPYNNTAFVFTLSPHQKLVPSLDSNNNCTIKSGFDGKQSIRYTVFDDSIYRTQTYNLCPDPTDTLQRQSLQNLNISQLQTRGWNKVYGTQPGYSRGREISTDGGQVNKGLISSVYAYTTINLTISSTTDSNGNAITELRGISGKYIKSISIYYSDVKTPTNNILLHALFAFDTTTSQTCNSINQQNQSYFQQETLIDNIGASNGYIAIDCRHLTADVIRLYGTQLNITSVTALCTNTQVYNDSVVISDAYSATFDSLGRLFVFYEDHNLLQTNCVCPSSSSSIPRIPSSSSALYAPGIPATPVGGGLNAGSWIPGIGGGTGGQSRPPQSYSSSSVSSSSATHIPISSTSATSSSSSFYSSSSSAPITTPCFGRDCIGCSEEGKKTYNSFTVGFSGYQQWQLCLTCQTCSGSPTGFIRIDPNNLTGPFCIVQDCNNPCIWENTVFIPVITSQCINSSCNSEFANTLLPLHIVATQSTSGWTLTATLADTECNTFTLFSGVYKGLNNSSSSTGNSSSSSSSTGYDPCDLPGQFINTANNSNNLTQNVCCICFPGAHEISNISCAMSTDMGNTWYDFKGIIRTIQGELARRPVVTFDKFQNRFHLFYTMQGTGANGLFHKVFDSNLFDGNDAFINYIPPASFDISTIDSMGLEGFSANGKSLRKIPSDLVSGTLSQSETNISIARAKNGQSYRFTSSGTSATLFPTGSVSQSQTDMFNDTFDITTDPIAFQEYDSYIDNKGHLYLYYFGQSGTLSVDTPQNNNTSLQHIDNTYDGQSSNLLRYNTTLDENSNCPYPYIFTISGINDPDCECNYNGDHIFTQNGDINHYISGIDFTLTFTDPYWIIASTNGMLTFQKLQNSSGCPPSGKYTLICSRCIAALSNSSSETGIGISGVLNPNPAYTNSSSSSVTNKPYDALVTVLYSTDDGKTWQTETPGPGGHFGALAYDIMHDFVYMGYVTGEMLFIRRYPAQNYQAIVETSITHTTTNFTLVPIDTSVDYSFTATGLTDTYGELGNISQQLDLPTQSETVTGTTTTTTQQLTGERDKGGAPTFCVGEITGGFYPYAVSPYPSNYIFDNNFAVGAARPAIWITPAGGVRFFFIDQQGNINAGYLASANSPLPDAKIGNCL